MRAWLIAALGAAPAAAADDMRCGQTTIRTGDDQASVLEACGEPAEKTTRMDGYTQLHVWTFDPPQVPSRRVVELEKGKVKSIR